MAFKTSLLENRSRGMRGTAQVMSVHTDQGPRSISVNGELLSSPVLIEISSALNGPKLVIISVLPPTSMPITETPCEVPGKIL